MARIKKPKEAENHERWLISYADFITLLFAFFVVMFASAQADRGKAKEFSQAVTAALEHDSVSSKVAEILGGTAGIKGSGSVDTVNGSVTKPNEPKTVDLSSSMKALNSELQREIQTGKLNVNLESRGLVISLKQATFFPSGDATIAPAAQPILQRLSKVIDKVPNPIRLEGHTDALPISNNRYRSNWELSAARGISVLEFLSGEAGIPRSRLTLVGYAENVPVAGNETEDGRARNRRVDIVLLNEAAAASEPKAAAQAMKGGTQRASIEAARQSRDF